MSEKRNPPPDVAGYLRDNPDLLESYLAMEDEGWIYLPYVDRQAYQRLQSATMRAIADGLPVATPQPIQARDDL